MTTLTAPALRTVAFGDLGAGVWGACWGASEPFVAVGTLQRGAVSPSTATTVEGSDPAEDWKLCAECVELTLSPEGEPASASSATGFDQLCRVRGRFGLDRSEQLIDCLGRRGSRPELDLNELESVRDVSAWFDPGEGLVLTALRPRGAIGHDRDIVTAAIFESAEAILVADPRLSTTYSADGLPVRAGLELWLEADEADEQYPRRAAGHALGARAAAALGEIDLQAHAFRWHSRGREGAGVYMLLRSR